MEGRVNTHVLEILHELLVKATIVAFKRVKQSNLIYFFYHLVVEN